MYSDFNVDGNRNMITCFCRIRSEQPDVFVSQIINVFILSTRQCGAATAAQIRGDDVSPRPTVYVAPPSSDSSAEIHAESICSFYPFILIQVLYYVSARLNHSIYSPDGKHGLVSTPSYFVLVLPKR